MEQNATAQSGARESVALTAKSAAIYGVKAGMTQIYNAEGDVIAVTVIDLRPNVITQVKTKAKEGYNAIQLGMMEKKTKSANKPEQGHYKKVSAPGFYVRKEIRLADTDKMDGLTAGKILSIDFIKEGDMVDLIAISKGKGFQGGMKRYHMAGGNKTHGASVNHRSLGSIGNRADPGKCFKNKKMAGQMGNVKRTVQNLEVVAIDKENQLILVHGSVPGPKSGIVTVRKAIKG